MAYYLRFGVYIWLVLIWLLCAVGLWMWQGWYWRHGYLTLPLLSTLSPLPERHHRDAGNWLWAGISSTTLQRHLLSVFAAKRAALQIQVDADFVRLSVLLKPDELIVMEALPLWPGWYVETMELKPEGGRWRLLLRWVKTDADVRRNVVRIPHAVRVIDASIWMLSEQRAAVGQPALQVEQPMTATKLTWVLLGYWQRGEHHGVWLLDADDVLQRVGQGKIWRGFELLVVDKDGVYWRGEDGNVIEQRLCDALFTCRGGL